MKIIATKIEEFDKDSQKIIRRWFTTRSVSESTAQTYLNKVGFTNAENTYRFWRSHNIRKYFYNIVEEIVGIEYADEWLGHVPNKVTMAYARREYRMKQAYLKCLPYLLLETDMEDFTQKINDLEEEIKRLKEKYE